MELPNNYIPINSTLALAPIILNEVKNDAMPAYELFKKVKPFLNDATDFLSVMDCLYALRAVDIDDKGDVFLCLQ